jgi:hypothetical protein
MNTASDHSQSEKSETLEGFFVVHASQKHSISSETGVCHPEGISSSKNPGTNEAHQLSS